MGYLSFTTAKVGKAIQIQSIARAGDGTVTVYVQNVGDSPVKLANVYADGELNVGASSDPAFGSELADKDTATITLYSDYSGSAQLTVKIVTSDGTFTELKKIFTGGSDVGTKMYSVTFSVEGDVGGTVDPSGPQSYPAGTIVPISANPDPDYVFDGWDFTGSIVIGDADASVTTATINGAGTITANFAVPQQVTCVSSGTGSGVGNTNENPTPAYPTGLQENDLILLQVMVEGQAPTITPPAGFLPLFGPESSAGSGSSRVTQAIYYKFAEGGETGTVTVTITQSTPYARGARMYSFRNVALSSFTEGASANPNTDNSNTYAAQTVTTSGIKRLAVSFEALGTNSIPDSFTGETGDDWTLPSPLANGWYNGAVGSLFSLGIQTATMDSQGTIDGGIDPSNTCYWIVRSFALIPG